ncbi:MAG: hypothetical protein IRZ28_20240 [Steroidobacteraceae bacterium]|nr:hypothetical protein [Steroidobacteraceae bacterium]
MLKSAALALIAAVLCVACGPGRLRPETPAGVNLAGTWTLKREASDDPVAMLDQIRRDLMRKRGWLDESGERSGGTVTTQRVPGAGEPQAGATSRVQSVGAGRRFTSRLSYARALEWQLSANALTIEQTPTRLVFIRDGSRRTFTPGGESVVSVENGVADQRSGWSGRQYVIDVRPLVGPRVIERYGLSADGELVEDVTLTEEGLPTLRFTRVYARGAARPAPLPTSN